MTVKNIVVCVTSQKTCKDLIEKGVEVAEKDSQKIYVLHVVDKKAKLLNNCTDGEALEYLFQITRELSGELVVERADNIPGAIINFVRESDVSHIVIGKSGEKKNSVENILRREFHDREIIVV